MGAPAAHAARERGAEVVEVEVTEECGESFQTLENAREQNRRMHVNFAKLKARLARIAEAHRKYVDERGGTDGTCVECVLPWPCPTYAWAAFDRDPVLDAWCPADDES